MVVAAAVINVVDIAARLAGKVPVLVAAITDRTAVMSGERTVVVSVAPIPLLAVFAVEVIASDAITAQVLTVEPVHPGDWSIHAAIVTFHPGIDVMVLIAAGSTKIVDFVHLSLGIGHDRIAVVTAYGMGMQRVNGAAAVIANVVHGTFLSLMVGWWLAAVGSVSKQV